MANICENRLSATGTVDQLDKLSNLIKMEFEIYSEDFIENDQNNQLELYFDSKWTFPEGEFKKITGALPDTNGLCIRVVSDEPAMNYLQQSIFQDGKWSYETC